MSDPTAAQIVEKLRECKFFFTDENGVSCRAKPPLDHIALESAWEALEGLVSVDGVEGKDAVRFNKARDDVMKLLEGSDD